MRPIKFRAWDISDERYLDASEFYLEPDGAVFVVEAESGVWYDREPTEIIIEQFTGILDVNGAEIYEGDVLKPIDPNGEPMDSFTVEWNKIGGWIFEDPDGFDGFDQTTIGWAIEMEYEFEVIGNIHEPEGTSNEAQD